MFTLKRKKDKELPELSELSENSEKSENSEISETSENSEPSETSEISETSEPSEPSEDSEPSGTLEESFAAWLDENVADEQRRQSALDAMAILSGCLESGEWSELLFDLIAKGADYSRAVTEAETVGEVRGRNASIDELMELEYATDGVPHPASGADTSRAPSIFDVARSAR